MSRGVSDLIGNGDELWLVEPARLGTISEARARYSLREGLSIEDCVRAIEGGAAPKVVALMICGLPGGPVFEGWNGSQLASWIRKRIPSTQLWLVTSHDVMVNCGPLEGLPFDRVIRPDGVEFLL